MINKIKYKNTPTRTPGGKSNALKYLDKYFIKDFSEFREPFFGGGSVGLYLMQFNKNAVYKINDLCFQTYCFWQMLYERPRDMQEFLISEKREYVVENDVIGQIINGKKIPSKSAENGRELHKKCRELIKTSKDKFQTACLWYILNKLSYSGMSMIGSYAPLAFDQNLTDSCIANLHKTSELMHTVKEVRITNLDYKELLNSDGDNVFIFLDPPYKIPHSLYGNDGELHRQFNHQEFANEIKKCNHKWLITYNQDDNINSWFPSPPYFKHEWDLTYTMKAAKRTDINKASIKIKYEDGKEPEKSGKKGKELLISNCNYENVV